jgi:septal ring factor EnvC (AmiA/AmiB activator)
MDYRAAAEIARKHPGAVITRDDSGNFVVRLQDGVVVGGTHYAAESNHDAQRAQELSEELDRVRSTQIRQEILLRGEANQLRKEIAQLKDTIREGNSAYSAAKLEISRVVHDLDGLRTENAVLRRKLAKVSATELERIATDDRLARETDAARRKAERKIVKCACRGEVENCARCYGKGQYTVDGYGNPV